MKLNVFYLKLKKFFTFCLDFNLHVIILIVMIISLFFYDSVRKHENKIELSDIKFNQARNFMTDISRDMNAATWHFGAERTNTSTQFIFQSGRVKFQECSPKTKEDVMNAFKKYQNLMVKEDKLFGQYFCIDKNVLIKMDFFEDDCKLYVNTKWYSSYSTCNPLID